MLPRNDAVGKRRKKGEESVKKERKRLKVSGLAYTNYKGVLKPAKNPPNAQVSLFDIFNLYNLKRQLVFLLLGKVTRYIGISSDFIAGVVQVPSDGIFFLLAKLCVQISVQGSHW